MYTYSKVDQMLRDWKAQGLSKPDIVVKLAYACLGWAYVFGARGVKCTPSNRRAWYNSKGVETIKTKCKNFNGTGSCSGCQWYPGGVTLFYDCRGFTYWCLLQGAGIKINGAGATAQWNDNSNWEVKGPIEEMPRDRVCCTFRHDAKTGKMEHTLLYDGNGYYIHDSGTVKKTAIGSYKATHYAIPKGLYDGPVPPTPVPPEPTPPSPDPGKAIVTGKNLALRQGPGTDKSVIIRIPTGTVIDIATLPTDWTYVKYGTRYGFVMSQFISVNGSKATVTGKNLALRQGPGTDRNVMVRIATGTKIDVVNLPDDWTYVKYGTKTGFVMNQFIQKG